LEARQAVKPGDAVTAGGEAGRVVRVLGRRVEVEVHGRTFWYAAAGVTAGTPPPKPVFMAARFDTKAVPRVEVRPVCRHLTLADLCDVCAKERGGSRRGVK
jgi:hypothetical protein